MNIDWWKETDFERAKNWRILFNEKKKGMRRKQISGSDRKTNEIYN